MHPSSVRPHHLCGLTNRFPLQPILPVLPFGQGRPLFFAISRYSPSTRSAPLAKSYFHLTRLLAPDTGDLIPSKTRLYTTLVRLRASRPGPEDGTGIGFWGQGGCARLHGGIHAIASVSHMTPCSTLGHTTFCQNWRASRLLSRNHTERLPSGVSRQQRHLRLLCLSFPAWCTRAIGFSHQTVSRCSYQLQ